MNSSTQIKDVSINLYPISNLYCQTTAEERAEELVEQFLKLGFFVNSEKVCFPIHNIKWFYIENTIQEEEK